MKKSILLLISLVFTLSIFAQVTTSSLKGDVVDEKGEPLIGAAILAKHVPSGTKYAAIANEKGVYTIRGMRTGGPYTIEISFIGMSTLEYKDIYLKLGETYELSSKMKSSNKLDAITVVAKKSFNASLTGAGSGFNQAKVENVPTVNRSVYDVVKFSPQASVGHNGGISFAGSNNRYNSFQIDGALANDNFGLSSSGTNGGQTGANPVSMDAIEQIQVVVAPFDVRQSGFTGGAINAITKSGTNKIKGSAYAFFNNQDFIGTTAGPLKEGQKRSKYEKQYSQTYGFTIGAPIVKDKLFIFASAEYFAKSRPNIYSPENGAYDDLKFSKNVISPDGTDLGNVFNADVAQAVINHYEKTYRVANTGEGFAPKQVKDRSINALLRLDWNINNSNKLMLRYQFMDAFADRYSSGLSSYYFTNSSYKQSNRTNTLVAELNSNISSSIQNMFRATAVFVRDRRSVPYSGAYVSIAGKDKLKLNIGTEKSSGANWMSSNAFTITDNMSIFLGKHEITLGTHNEIHTFENLFLQYAFGGYSFKTIQDFFNNKIDKFDYKYSDPKYTNNNTRWAAKTIAAQFGFYIQDEWKPNRDFTLTYGLRMDLPMLLNKPTRNEQFNNTAISLKNNERVGVVPKIRPLWSPRVGFRWYVNKDHTILLRGGMGLFTGRVPFVWLSNAYNNTGIEAKSVTKNKPYAVGGADSNGNMFLPENFADGTNEIYPNIVGNDLASAGGLATINTLSQNFKYPQVFRVNLGYEQRLPYGFKLTADALFSKTLNNVFFKNLALNRVGDVYGVNSKVAGLNPKSVAPRYTLDKSYSAVIALMNTNKGYTASFSTQLEKHFNFGLDLMAAYTYSLARSINDGKSSVARSNWAYNGAVDTNTPELSYSFFDSPHKVMGVISYTSPIYGKRFSTTVSLTYTGRSGSRYSYTMNEQDDFNGDNVRGNSMLYIPTSEEIGRMNWVAKEGFGSAGRQAADFENFIREDEYLSSHRGQWAGRYAGIMPFENNIDLHISQNIIYDRKHNRKVEIIFDILNLGNLFNRNWGLSYNIKYNAMPVLSMLKVEKGIKGNYTPSYQYNPTPIRISDFYSRWRSQLGLRITF